MTYANASAPPKFISNVTVTGTGSPNVFTTTAAPGATAGQYLLTGFGAGSYTVTLSKTTGQNSVTSNDAARIAQHVAGISVLTTDIQKVSADVSGNGSVSSNDAAFIARFAAGLGAPIGNTNTWQFYLPPGPTFPIGASPTTRTYASVIDNLTGEDYVGILIGEVTGNWTPSAARQLVGKQFTVISPDILVDLPTIVTTTDNEVVVPVSVHGTENKEIISYEFDLRYDPAVIQPLVEPVDVTSTASRGLSFVTNIEEPGLLRVVVYGAYPVERDGLLLNLRFTAVGSFGSASPLLFDRIMFNEGESDVITTDGQVEISNSAQTRP